MLSQVHVKELKRQGKEDVCETKKEKASREANASTYAKLRG